VDEEAETRPLISGGAHQVGGRGWMLPAIPATTPADPNDGGDRSMTFPAIPVTEGRVLQQIGRRRDSPRDPHDGVRGSWLLEKTGL
jgi:hypothetical protein